MLFHNIDTCYMADVIAIWETLVHPLILYLQAGAIAFCFFILLADVIANS